MASPRTSPTAPRSPPKAQTPMAFVQAIVQAYAQRGMDASGALRAAQIRPSALHRAGARITAAQMERVSAHAMRELDDEALGWFSRRLPWGSYGMLARASLGAPDLATALRRWCRHHGLIAPDIGLQLRVSAGVAEITLTDQRADDELREFCHVTILRNIHGLACWYIDSAIALLGASFAFAPPAHAASYAVLFPGPVEFAAERSTVRFDARYLDQPLRRDEQALQTMLKRALPLIVQSYRRDRLLIERARQSLQTDPALARNASRLAAALHVSTRTLHRHLHEQGASLQTLKDQARMQHAMELLQRSTLLVKQVAQAVGYGNEKSFIRAFRAWSGQTPSGYRGMGP